MTLTKTFETTVNKSIEELKAILREKKPDVGLLEFGIATNVDYSQIEMLDNKLLIERKPTLFSALTPRGKISVIMSLTDDGRSRLRFEIKPKSNFRSLFIMSSIIAVLAQIISPGLDGLIFGLVAFACFGLVEFFGYWYNRSGLTSYSRRLSSELNEHRWPAANKVHMPLPAEF